VFKKKYSHDYSDSIKRYI